MTDNLSGPDPRPLGDIGLSLSGGGFRAAAFHLGVLSALDRIGLLEKVRVLSTVSGGSFIGAAFALAAARGEAFASFYGRCRDFLAGSHLPRAAIGVFRSQAPRTPSATRTLIKAAAQVYDETLYDGARFGELLEARSHLRDVIVNATEFRTGVAFRFRASTRPQVRIGNGNLSIPREAAARLRIADLVASSSCFPGAFEPMVLPHDFNWSSEDPGAVPEQLADFEPVALMDGGISDNQGVDSVRLADRGQGVELDMVIVSDTDRAGDELYPPPTSWPSCSPRLWLVGLLLAVASVVLAGAGGWLVSEAIQAALTRELRLLEDLLGLWVPALACLGLAALPVLALGAGLRRMRRILPKGLRPTVVATLAGLGVGEAFHLVKVRVGSLIALTSHVFTRRIRRQVFDAAYEEPGYRERLVPSLISRLTRARSPGRLPSPELREVAERAGAMPTTLWFEHPGQLDDLIACGQATICHALLEHLPARTDAGKQLQRAEELWQELCRDPLSLVD